MDPWWWAVTPLWPYLQNVGVLRALFQIIIVGVDNAGAARTDEYTYCVDPTVGQGGKADIYLDFLQETVKPIIVVSLTASSFHPCTRDLSPAEPYTSLLPVLSHVVMVGSR